MRRHVGDHNVWFVVVHQARSIQDVQVFGTQDPYVLGTLLPRTGIPHDEPERTHTVVSGGVAPCWDSNSTQAPKQGMLFTFDALNTNLLGRAVLLEVGCCAC